MNNVAVVKVFYLQNIAKYRAKLFHLHAKLLRKSQNFTFMWLYSRKEIYNIMCPYEFKVS